MQTATARKSPAAVHANPSDGEYPKYWSTVRLLTLYASGGGGGTPTGGADDML